MDAIAALQLAQQLFVPFQRQLRMKATLHQYSTSAELKGFLHLLKDFVEAQDVAFTGPWLAEESTEGTHSRADVAVVDISIDDVGNDIVGMEFFPQIISQPLQLLQRGGLSHLKVLGQGQSLARFQSFEKFWSRHCGRFSNVAFSLTRC